MVQQSFLKEEKWFITHLKAKYFCHSTKSEKSRQLHHSSDSYEYTSPGMKVVTLKQIVKDYQ